MPEERYDPMFFLRKKNRKFDFKSLGKIILCNLCILK